MPMTSIRVAALCGYLPDPADVRDYPFTALSARLSAGPAFGSGEPFEIPYNRPARDQGVRPSCVGQSIVRALEVLDQRLPDLSGRALWYVTRQAEGRQDVDGGTTLRNGLAQLRRIGAVRAALDAETEPHDLPLSVAALEDAHDHRGGDYYRVPQGDLEAVERAIRAGHPVVCGGQVDEAFANAVATDIITAPTGRPLGGHAVCLVGVRGFGPWLEVLIDNSWGSSWGDVGRCWADAEWLRSRWDLWVVTRGVA